MKEPDGFYTWTQLQASYGRNSLKDLVSKAAKDVFIPITVGGGIRSIETATDILRNGAEQSCSKYGSSKKS